MEYKKHSIGKYSYGIEGGKCLDATEKDVSNFNFEDGVFNEHLKDKSHENH